METINVAGKKYKVSAIDTKDTIKNMIALKNKTFPNFIRFTTFDPPTIKVELLKDSLKVKKQKLAQTVEKLHEDWGIPKSDIALEWLGKKLTEFDVELEKIFSKINSTDFWNINTINTALATFNERKNKVLKDLELLVEKEEKYRTEYNKYSPVETSKFLQDSVIIEYKIKIDADPMDVFDNISLNKEIVYVRLKTASQTYYKVSEKVTPLEEWLDGDDMLTFKLRAAKDYWGTATINYTSIDEAILSIESTINIDQSGKQETSEEKIKNYIINSIGDVNINIQSREEKGVKGVFAVPEVSIDRDIFLDLITNDPIVSHYLYTDETRDLSSTKGVLYLYYSTGSSDDSQVLTVFLSQRVVSRSDPMYISRELLLFTPYLNVRVSRATNKEQIERFKEAFALILDVYRKKYSQIAKEYDALIPGFKKEHSLKKSKTTGVDKKLKILQKQDAGLFIHGYPIKCEPKRQPIPINEKDVKKHDQVLNYPTNSDNYFVCSQDGEYNYPGLMNNKLDNADEYPYIPCCYKNNQLVGNKLWNAYLKNLDKIKKKSSNIVSKKAIQRDQMGYLPRNVHYILNKTGNATYFRQGVEIGNNSFIEAVLLAFDPNYEKMPNQDKSKYVQDFRTNLAGKNLASVIQELYDVDQDKIIQDIMDPDVVFDSKIFIGLLEAFYNCQIVVFERTEQSSNGEYEIPRYTQGYLYKQLNPKRKTIFIYKHIGIRADALKNPHYELILRKENLETRWYFVNEKVINNVYSYFLKTYKLYIIGNPQSRYRAFLPDFFRKADSQFVDRYGKTRGFIFEGVYIVTSPLPPIKNLQITKIPTKKPIWKDVEIIIKKYKIKIIQQDISGNKTIGVMLNIPNLPYAYIPFKSRQPFIKYEKSEHLGFIIPTENSILDKTLYNKKVADYLMQLLLYSFSKWYSKQEPGPEQGNISYAEWSIREKARLIRLVEEYLDREITIEPDYIYDLKNLTRTLTTNNTFFKKGTLIVESQETFNRLGYYLRFMIDKNRDLVINYSNRIHLDNYYTNPNDFIEREGELIFIGPLSINNWLSTKIRGVSNQVSTVPQPSNKEPFFFSHWAMHGGKPIIFQNVQGGKLERALAVASNFTDDKINIGYNAKPIEIIEHTVYFIKDGILYKEGDSPIRVWRYTKDIYGALLFP